MTQWLKRVAKSAAVGAAALVLTFGAHTLYASSAPISACSPQDPGYLGTCPTYTPETCEMDCEFYFQTDGNQCVGGCCICQTR